MSAPPPRARPRRLGAPARFATGPLSALAPWAELFADAPETQLRVLGALLDAVAPFIEEEEERAERRGRDEIAGFEDIAPLGPLDGLLDSELVWLGLAPQEFARRIGENEALRRRPERRDKTDDRARLLILDAGPDMLGRRRLVSLALLFAMAARRRVDGARLIWTSTAFHGAPYWFDGFDRRALSRLARQTSPWRWGETELQARLALAPDGARDGPVWLITAPACDAGAVALERRIDVDETWEEEIREPDAPRPRARVSAVRGDGAARALRFAYPAEEDCADLLRAPFATPAAAQRRAAQGAAGTEWRPAFLTHGGDRGTMMARLGRTLVFRGGSRVGARAEIPEERSLLGARMGATGAGAIAMRDADGVELVRFTPENGVFDRHRAPLPADHPLMRAEDADDRLPPLMRIGHPGVLACVGADGALHALHLSTSATQARVERLTASADLRVRARDEAALLCEGPRGLSLLTRRTRIPLDEAISLEGALTGFAFIGEDAGALVRDGGGWRVVGRRGDGAQDGAGRLSVPPLAETGLVLDGGRAPKAPSKGRWTVVEWSAKVGLRIHLWTGERWSTRRVGLAGPARAETDAATRALLLCGKTVYRVRQDEDDAAPTLLEGRLEEAAAPRSAETQPWFEGLTWLEL